MQTTQADAEFAIHRRSEARCRVGVPGTPQEVIGLYLASSRQHIGNDLAALGRWKEAEAPLSYALAHFQAARMPAWSEVARLELGIVLRHLARRDEARAALTAAHDALVRLNNPRRLEAAAELRTLDTTAVRSAGPPRAPGPGVSG